MPKVVLIQDQETFDFYVRSLAELNWDGIDPNERPWNSVVVEMNNSLYRQIRAAEKKYLAFQDKINTWAGEALAGERQRITHGR